MAGVPSATENYKYYKNSVNELEEDYDKQVDRLKQKHQRELDRLDEAQADAKADQEEETTETVENVKKAANETIQNERDRARAEVSKLKNEMYNRLGRSNGEEASVLQQQVDEYARAQNEIEEGNQRSRQAADELYHYKLQQKNVEHANQLEDAVRKARDSALQAYTENYADDSGEYHDHKKKLENKYAHLSQELRKETHENLKENLRKVQEAERDTDRQISMTEEARDHMIRTNTSASNKRLEDTMESASKSHKGEVAQLQKSIHELSDFKKQTGKHIGEARSEAISDYEDYWRTREWALREAYGAELKKAKSDIDKVENDLINRQELRMKDRENQFNQILSNQIDENRDAISQSRKGFELERDHMKSSLERERRLASERMEQQQETNADQMQNALKKQADAYQKTIDNQRQSNSDQLRKLQDKLVTKETSSDPTDLSPAAEEAIRNLVTKEYEKKFDVAHKKNDATIDSIKSNYSQRLRDVVRASEEREMSTTRKMAQEKNMEQTQLMQTIVDVEQLKEQTVGSLEASHQKTIDKMTKNFSLTLDQQRRQYEGLLEAQKLDSQTQIQTLIQESDFREKMMQRQFSAEQGETIRNYEKRMQEQKENHEIAMNDIKADADKRIRDMERRMQTEIEAQNRGYQQQLAQMEFQQKERERVLTQNYEGELDKVKRSNAQLIRKKS